MLRAYVVAGVVGSGPWVISISSMLLIGVVSTRLNLSPELITPFLATVTYLMATSLTLSGMLQLLFVRFIADRLFEKREEAVAPNLLGALVVTTAGSALLGG